MQTLLFRSVDLFEDVIEYLDTVQCVSLAALGSLRITNLLLNKKYFPLLDTNLNHTQLIDFCEAFTFTKYIIGQEYKKDSYLKIAATISLSLGNLMVIPCSLDEWSLVDCNRYLKAIASIPYCSWINKPSLDDYGKIAMCAGFYLNCCRAFLILNQRSREEEEKTGAKWLIVVSVTGLVFNGLILLRAQEKYVHLALLGAYGSRFIAKMIAPQSLFEILDAVN